MSLLDKGFKFEVDVCNRCHDVLMMSINLNDVATLNIKCVYYGCIINNISKSDAINLMQNADFNEEKKVLSK